MFACEDFKGLNEAPSGTKKRKSLVGRKKKKKELMSESGMQHAASSCVTELRPWMRFGYV